MTTKHQAPVLIVGAGPAGLIASLQLARLGVRCTLVERNLDTTKWPKMDITNCRSMELFNRLGISQGLREQGVDQKFSLNVLASTGLTEGGKLIAQWDLPSPNAWRTRIKALDDGSLPREPYQRCSQAVLEAWLKPRIQAESRIDSHFGLKLESLSETDSGIESTLTDVTTGETHIISSQYVIGCDGASSRVRRAIGAELIGGPVSPPRLLVHFKSRDLSTLQKQGQFWHIFFSSGAALIAQDEIDTWTVHLPVAADTDWRAIDPEAAIYQALGGSVGPCPIKVDQILVTSAWVPNICIANHYISAGGRVFLAGDAAHQNIPTGGYGMNTAVGDSFDIGWKLAAVLQGYGGKHLLPSYESERMPVAARNIERSRAHAQVHQEWCGLAMAADAGVVSSSSPQGKELRERIARHFLAHDGENKDLGIEMGYRHTGSPIVVPDRGTDEPAWSVREYHPSTWPGARPPHMFLADGEGSIYDLFGPGYTIVDFTRDGKWADRFMEIGTKLGVPMKKVHLPEETRVAKVWEREAVLVRPDDHVAWRASLDGNSPVDVEEILKVSTGNYAAL